MEYMGQAAGDAAWPLLFWEHLCALSADWQSLKNLQGEEAKLQKKGRLPGRKVRIHWIYSLFATDPAESEILPGRPKSKI